VFEDKRASSPLVFAARRGLDARGLPNTSLQTRALPAKPWVGALVARLCGAEKRRAFGGAHAVRASTSDSRRVFERSERSERSEFCRAPKA
jgi:hypothetical protein